MSYEGYNQYVCVFGHRYDADCYDDGDCPFCGGSYAFLNSVDETNHDSVGFIPPEEWEKFLVSPQVEHTCNLGHVHVVKPAVYRIPTTDDRNRMRHRCDSQGKLVPYIRRS